MNALIKHLETALSSPPAVQDSTYFRLFHGRGKTVPGLEFLTIDSINNFLLITIFKNTLTNNELEEISLYLKNKFKEKDVIIQNRAINPPGIHAETDIHNIVISENGIKYHIDFCRGQNSGFFPDMRELRILVSRFCSLYSGKAKVLNLFAYTCSFSAAALSGGAASVINMDMKKQFLMWGKKNHTLNGFDQRKAQFLAHNVFKSWSKLKHFAPYNLIICDPPSMQGESFQIDRDYPKLIKRVRQLVSNECLVLFAVNSPKHSMKYLEEICLQNSFKIAGKVYSPADFPEKNIEEGLKVLLAVPDDIPESSKLFSLFQLS